MINSTSSTSSIPNIQFSHLGICVMDLETMKDFYSRVLGMTVTDEGHVVGLDVVFLSRNPVDHHQIVLTTGRPRDIPSNTGNPMFGPVINQVSFKLETLAELKQMHMHVRNNYETEITYLNHGTAWSFYFPDPEGNPIEIYVDTEWYVKQPVAQELDLSLDDEVILEQTRVLCESSDGYRPANEWREEYAKIMGILP